MDAASHRSGDTSNTLSLYQSEKKIHPREMKGRFQRLRVLAMLVLLGLYYGGAWLSFDGRQAILFDLPARKFHLFGWTVWPQDFVYLAALLILAALALFFFTALAGRLWCGYACPQTVWTEAFLWMERITEGDFRARQKLDRAPWSSDKLLRKSAKHVLWLLFALWTGFTFVGYFSPIKQLLVDSLNFSLGGWELFWGLFYSVATWGNAGILREQVCKYMCPYARFQGAMFDSDTLIISYDATRGDPRGSRRKTIPSVLVDDRRAIASDNIALGDCIDCTICVQVCPTGIDIRDGLQIECIACGACIDACDSVMDKIGYPRGLVRYTTQHAMEKKPSKLLRTRVLVYAGLLFVISGALLASILLRDKLHLDVLRDRNALYRVGEGGAIENTYTFKLVNKDSRSHRVVIQMKARSASLVFDRSIATVVEKEGTAAVSASVRAPAGTQGMHVIEFVAKAVDAPDTIIAKQTSRFFAPMDGG